MEEIKKLLPEIPDTWIAFNIVDWNDKAILAYHVDTWDFHVSCCTQYIARDIDEKTISKVKYKNRFYFTADEVSILIKKLFNESGGSIEWRFLSFRGKNNDWCKYIRIYRRKDLFLVCDMKSHPKNKEFWNQEQNEQYI